MSLSDTLRDRALALLVAAALDLALGEPPAPAHPVVWLGAAIDALESRAPWGNQQSELVFGAAAAGGLTLAATLTALVASSRMPALPRPLRVLALAVLLKPAFSLRALLAAGSAVRSALERGDLALARRDLQALVSRETALLSAANCAGAAIESLAENTTDSIIGPWLTFLCFGLTGAWCFRTINTFDSRWGYRGRYDRLGRAAARADDLAAAVPARLSAMLLIAASAFHFSVTALGTWFDRLPTSGHWPTTSSDGHSMNGGLVNLSQALAALRCSMESRRKTGSPNSGWTMGAMAGGLGLKLSKFGSYVLNPGGLDPVAADIARAQELVAFSALLALATGAAGAFILGSRPSR